MLAKKIGKKIGNHFSKNVLGLSKKLRNSSSDCHVINYFYSTTGMNIVTEDGLKKSIFEMK